MASASRPLPIDEYKQVVESFAQAVWETDAKGLIVTDSPSWRAYTGQSPEEWLEEGWVAAIHPDDRSYALHQWQEALRRQTPVKAEFRLRSPNGGWRWTDVRVTAIKGADGTVQKWVGLNIDISERKQAEEQLTLDQNRQRAEALQASQNLLRATLDSSLDLIQVFDAVRDEQGTIIDFTWVLNNQAAETIYGDVVCQRLLTLNPGVVAEGIFDTFKRVIETGTPDVSERHYVHEQFDGWFYQSTVKLNDGVSTTTSDITERKKAEQELKDQADFISSVMQATSAIISITNPAGDIVFNNRDAFTLLGFDVDEIAQMKREDRMKLVHPDDTSRLSNFYASVDSLEDGREVTVQFRSKNKAGDYVWLDTRTKLLERDETGKAAQFLYVTQDITAQKKAEQEILRLNDELAQQVADTYQTLFNSIDQGFNILELMVDEQGKPTDFRILQTNQAWCQQTGLLDATGKTLREITPTFEQSLIESYADVALSGQSVRLEYYTQSLERWYTAFATRIGGAQSRQVVIVFNDITERKRHEENLAFLAEVSDDLLQMRRIDETIALLGGKIGEKFGATWCNFAEMSEDSETVVVTSWNADGMPSLTRVHKLKDLWTDERAARHSRGEVTVVNDTQDDPLVNAAGLAAINIRSYISVPLARDWAFKFMLAICKSEPCEWRADEIKLAQELTTRIWMRLEKARAEEALRTSEEKYRSLFNSIDEGFCIFELLYDDEGRVVDWLYTEANSAFERQTGYINPIGKRISEFQPDLERSWFERFAQVARTGEPVRFVDYTEAMGIWYDVYALPVGPAGDNRVSLLFTDITERKQREQEQSLLLTLDDKIRPLTDSVTIEGDVTQLLRAHVDAGWCYYIQWNEAAKRGVVRRDATGKGLPSLVGEHDVSDVPEFLELLKANPLLHVSDYEHFERLTPELRHRYRSVGFRSMLVATLVKQEHLVASLLIGDTKIRHWSIYEQALLMQVAERTWAAVEQAKAQEALRKSESRLAQDLANAKQLQHFSNEVIHLNEPNEIYELLLQTATNLMQSDFASIQVYSEQTETLTLVAHKAFHPESAAFWRTVSAESGSVCGEALRHQSRILVTDVETEEFAKSELEIFRLSGIRAVQSTPITSSSRKLIGMLNTQWKQPRRFSEDEFRFFDVLVRQAADFIEKRQTEEALRESEEKYRSLFNSIDEGFALVELIYMENGTLVDFSYKEINPAFINHVGMNLQGRRRSELFFDKKDFLLEKYDQLARTGEPLHLEYSVQQLDSQWFQMTASRIGGVGSRLLGVVFRNITERKQREQHQAFLLRLSDILRTHLTDTATLQQAALQLLAEQVDVMRAIYYEAEPDQDTFTLTARFDQDAVPIPDQLRLSDFSPTVADAYRSGRTQLVTDTENEPFPEAYRAIGIRAWLAVPFVKDGRLVTVVGVHAKTPRSWTAIEVQLVEEFATRIWAAVERARAEEVLRATERRLLTVLQQAPLAIAITGSTGEILFRNTVFDQIWGRPTHDTSASTYSDVYEGYHLDGRPIDSPEWPASRAVLNGEIIQGEVLYLVHLDGRRILCSHNAAPIRDEAGNITGGVVMFEDVSAEWAAQQALRESGERLYKILSIQTVGFIYFDLDGRIYGANAAFEAMSGYTNAELTGGRVRWDELTPPEFMATTLKSKEELLTTGQNTPYEKQYIRPDGSRWWGLFAGKRVSEQEYVEFVLDISESKQARQELEETARRKDEFLAMLAHELRNPLTPVRNGLQLLAQTHAEDPILDTILPIMNRQMDHLVRMVDDLLDVSRISRGKIELRKQRIDLTVVVGQAIEALQPLFTSSGRQLHAQLPEHPLYLEGDATRLHQVVTNLLTNGLRYTQEGGQVWLTVEPLDEQTILRVRDNGIGLAADQLDAIFELFVQVDKSLARSHGGLGLGLSLVRELVTMHGGRISAYSEGLEQGSEFIVYLPILSSEHI